MGFLFTEFVKKICCIGSHITRILNFELNRLEQAIHVVDQGLLVQPRHVSTAQEKMLLNAQAVIKNAHVVKVVNAGAQQTLFLSRLWCRGANQALCELMPSSRPFMNG